MNPPTAHSPPKVEQSDTIRIITFTADKVRDAENMLARELEGRTDALGSGHLLLHFTNVEYLNSAELGTLIALHKRLKADGARLTLFNLNAEVYEVFTITHLQRILGICREDMPPPAAVIRPSLIKDRMDGVKETARGDCGDPAKYLCSE